MKYSELLNKEFKTETSIFKPKYSYDSINPIFDDKNNIIDWEIVNYTEIKTAEEVYQEWLNINNNPQVYQPTSDEILRANLLKDNVSFKLQLSQQQKINANLLTQIAKLGGVQ